MSTSCLTNTFSLINLYVVRINFARLRLCARISPMHIPKSTDGAIIREAFFNEITSLVF